MYLVLFSTRRFCDNAGIALDLAIIIVNDNRSANNARKCIYDNTIKCKHIAAKPQYATVFFHVIFTVASELVKGEQEVSNSKEKNILETWLCEI